ncbi:MAG TPA: DinB family protein [Streptosporangiaceae bacterium]|nr:DinB family protein [Streptosporangiaceae bacterium]
MTAGETTTLTGERADLVASLDKHRYFLRHTVRGLSDEQVSQRTTASELTLAGVIKHVAATEQQWVRFITEGPSVMAVDYTDEAAITAFANTFRMLPGETLAGILAEYGEVASRTDELVATLPDLDASQPLPDAPWFEKGARWSARRVFLHIIAETSQHAGHADIIRESLDGAKSMG